MKTTIHFIVLMLLVAQISNAQTSLWATATTGGAYGFGTILKGNADGSNFQRVFSFDSTNGSFPIGKLATANNGKIYGVTYLGACDDSCTCFCYDPVSNSVNVLYQFFLQIQYGGIPYAGMVNANNGKLYGMTSAGGANGSGVIYSMDPTTNTYADVYDFDGVTASNPSSEFLQASDGKLYAVTSGGSSNNPVLFSFDPGDNQMNVVHNFSDYTPYFLSLRTPDLIQASNNLIYGIGEFQDSASGHIGVLFSYDLVTGACVNLHNFSVAEGIPCGGITEVAGGKLFGTTTASIGSFQGELFSYDINSHTFSNLQAFDAVNGYFPIGALSAVPNGSLIGSMSQGGANGNGVLFTVNPANNVCTKIFDFNAMVTGASPMCDVMMLDAPNPTVPGGNQITSGIQNVSGSQFAIYPNPTSGILYVQNAQPDAPYIITNIAGQEVAKGTFTNPQQVIDVSKLASGVYLLNKTRFTKE
jgi:uncharacterized repeat protein (TIGR03803 family)